MWDLVQCDLHWLYAVMVPIYVWYLLQYCLKIYYLWWKWYFSPRWSPRMVGHGCHAHTKSGVQCKRVPHAISESRQWKRHAKPRLYMGWKVTSILEEPLSRPPQFIFFFTWWVMNKKGCFEAMNRDPKVMWTELLLVLSVTS